MKQETLKKYFTRDASLIAFQVWHNSGMGEIQKWLKWEIPKEFFENKNGLVSNYLTKEAMSRIYQSIVDEIKKDKNFVRKSINKYLKLVKKPMKIWQSGQVLKTRKETKQFFSQLVKAWPGTAIAYFVPQIDDPEILEKDRKIALKARTLTDDLFDKSNEVFLKTISKLNPEISEHAKYISIEEFISDKIPDIRILKKRKKHYILFNFKIIIDKSLNELARKYNLRLEKVVVSNRKIIKGTIAMQGKVRGKVKIILTKNQIQKIDRGNILVTLMTTPNFLPAMKKAGAIITDEGGITCHAAIVSRELGIPCIIGTKIATKVLKDGDLVEVDADKGIVKIIK